MVKSEVITSPNVSMAILDETGNTIDVARIGDPLVLKFQITEKESPFEIFIQELIAIDGNDNSEITLIDRNGCPTDTAVMSAVKKSAPDYNGKSVQTTFQAFKFPASDMVQFRALITPCLPTCKPAHCVHWDYESAANQQSLSFGRRKRDVNSTSKDELLVVGAILIDDSAVGDAQSAAQTSKHKKVENMDKKYISYISNKELNDSLRSNDSHCFDILSIILVCAIFLIAQLVLIVVWFVIWRKTKVFREYCGFFDYKKQWEQQQQQQFLYNTMRRANSSCSSGHKCRYPDLFITGNSC
ncbi:hypothetical protein B4U80_07752 [Leptotrombidium deliense]|uniref:ZP domain-containing protein n=1 Tax=Leptotrombidium deliense TaxID=299467 RepID=A0A443SQ27_9ACAR|nr:hypothetical protein B4U80_07752 [Leptotrombidium deliense]